MKIKALLLTAVLGVALTSCSTSAKTEQCAVQNEQVATLNGQVSQLEAEAKEKDKKIVWLRDQAKKAGANLNPNGNK